MRLATRRSAACRIPRRRAHGACEQMFTPVFAEVGGFARGRDRAVARAVAMKAGTSRSSDSERSAWAGAGRLIARIERRKLR